MTTRTIWYTVAELNNSTAEPFAVLCVDTSILRHGGVEGTVVSVHWSKEEAQRVTDDFNGHPLIPADRQGGAS